MNPFSIVRDFERVIAEYTGAPHAVAVDSCTSALFLACKYHNVGLVRIPKRTYPSVPCSIIHAGGNVTFQDRGWRGSYSLYPYPIIDGACRFKRGMYFPGTHYCVSFQARKHLPIGRGGMILTDDAKAADWYRLARFSGRHEVPLMEDRLAMIGWSCYMTPEQAARGLTLMMNVNNHNEDLRFDYPDLSTFGLYQEAGK